MPNSEIARGNSVEGVDGTQLLRSTLIGVAAGLAASWIMNRFQDAVTAASAGGNDSEGGEQDQPATVKAADAVSDIVTGEPVPDDYEEVAGNAVHYGFGAFLGGLYGAAGEVLPEIRAGFGTAYGVGVAVVADEALVPAAGLGPPPQGVPVQTHAYGLVSHLVFGAALEASRRLIERATLPSAGAEGAGDRR